jgi:PAS domain S-box-containing protein
MVEESTHHQTVRAEAQAEDAPSPRHFEAASSHEVRQLRQEVARLTEALRDAEALLGIAPAFFGFLSPEGNVLRCNALALQVIESSADKVFGTRFWEGPWWASIPTSAARVEEAVRQAASGQASQFDIEYWAIRGGVGGKRWVTLVVSPHFDQERRVTQIAATGIDITEQQEGQEALRRSEDRLWAAVEASEKAKEDLRQSEERLRRMVEVTELGSWELDLATEEVQADARFCELFGLPVAKHFSLEKRLSAIHPEDRARVTRALADAAAGKDGGRYAEEYRTAGLADGRPRWVEARGRVTFSPEGQALRFLGTVRDISARKEAEATLKAK